MSQKNDIFVCHIAITLTRTNERKCGVYPWYTLVRWYMSNPSHGFREDICLYWLTLSHSLSYSIQLSKDPAYFISISMAKIIARTGFFLLLFLWSCQPQNTGELLWRYILEKSRDISWNLYLGELTALPPPKKAHQINFNKTAFECLCSCYVWCSLYSRVLLMALYCLTHWLITPPFYLYAFIPRQ